MKFKPHKKASLSLSIDMIVFVVIGFVMLGLMLTLGRNIVTKAMDTSNSVSEQTKSEIINQLTKSDNPLYFNQRQYDVGFGQMITITFGIKNVNPSASALGIVIDNVNGAAMTRMAPSSRAISSSGDFFWDSTGQELSAGESRTFDVQYYAPKNRGTYLFKVRLYESAPGAANATQVAEQTVFINVK